MVESGQESPERGFKSTNLHFIDEKDARKYYHQPVQHHEFTIELETAHRNSERVIDIIEKISDTEAIHIEHPTEELKTQPVLEEIDDDFFCKLCRGVVRNPVECTECETFYCQVCADARTSCVNDCETFTCRPLGKFAQRKYSKLRINCSNHGCVFSDFIETVISHESTCPLKSEICQNPQCSKSFFTKESAEASVCSPLCGIVHTFAKCSISQTPSNLIVEFSRLLSEAKKIIESRISSQMKDTVKQAEDKKREIADLNKLKGDLEKEIKQRVECHHYAKWNIVSNMWTCCGDKEKFSVGCKNYFLK